MPIANLISEQVPFEKIQGAAGDGLHALQKKLINYIAYGATHSNLLRTATIAILASTAAAREVAGDPEALRFFYV